MAQAFVQKVFHERKTNSTIQVPVEESLIDEEHVKKVIQDHAKEFFDQENQNDEKVENSHRCYLLACALTKVIIAQCQSVKKHKVVVNVFISEQEGQGMKYSGKCLWNSNCDRVVSANVSNDKEICIISVFFSKIPEDSDSEDED